jgi:predicted transcriptional regulator
MSESGEYGKLWRSDVMRGIELLADQQRILTDKIDGKDGIESRLARGETTIKALWKIVWMMVSATGAVLFGVFAWLLSNVKLT